LPKLSGVIETALYVDDLDRARAFYEKVLGLVPLTADSRFLAYDVGTAACSRRRASSLPS
jgi:catechol 2,3-dioxygenase-like lactoylglutathione lyase family enzyme